VCELIEDLKTKRR